MKILLPILFSLLLAPALYGQPDPGYYLPEGVSYDPSIPTPKSVIGHEVGEWHVTHDRLVQYMYALDKASDRISLAVTGYTHEDRPLLLLTITSPANHANLENLRRQHVQLTDPATSASLDTKNMPAVFYMGFSVHGNEASGVNAALLVAYHLAAAQGKEIQDYLAHTIVVFDPCYNPDGMQRFTSWVNSRKSKVIAIDPNDEEHHEAWPGGRFNHYWFDLNRDWLVAQHPESQARVKSFHHWKPNVLTDHHEMGTNETFFFQPGVPSRNHPLTPAKNFELTKRIAAFHAQALDAIGSFYFTQKEFDDFFYGKGSTFPDIQGAIGILFEQASARGHAQESVNGVLRFEFAVRNQFTTALSSLKAVNALREELLNYQRQFFKDAVAEAAKDPVKAIIFGAEKDRASAYHLAEVLLRQNIEVHPVASTQKINGKTFDDASAFVVPMNQPQYKLIKGMFERRTQFRDSVFYDISGWTLPLAFGVDYEELTIAPATGPKITTLSLPPGKRVGGKSEYAYAFESNGFYTPRALYRLLRQGLRVKVATDPFQHPDGKKFDRGTILLPIAGQDRNPDQIEYILQEITTQDGIDVYAFNSGLDFNGSSLGSRSFVTIKKPEIAILVGDGISASPAGEMWHLLDTRFGIPVTLLPLDVFNRTNLSRYTTIILPPLYSSINIHDAGKEKLKAWVQGGGVLIGFENSLSWLSGCGFGKFEMKKKDGDKADTKDDAPRAYADIDKYTDSQVTSGAIFEVAVDLTHPLLYGYDHPRMAVFRSHNLFMEKAKNVYGNPIVFTSAPLLSGYVSKANYVKIKETAAAGASAMGQGRVIGFTENLCFRGFWFGTNKLLMNAIFYGSLISNASCR